MGDPESFEGNGGRPLTLLSVVVAVSDRADAIQGLHERLRGGLEGVPYELLMVDDGSTDASAALLDQLAAEEPRVRVIHLSRAFGPEVALTAGLDHAQGDAVVTLDPDLRDPPEAIHLLLEQWWAGAEVVYGVRERGEGDHGGSRAAAAGWLARPLERLSGVELEPDAGDLRLLDRRAVQALFALRERSRFLRGMTVWVGFAQTAVTYRPDEAGAAPAGRGLRGMVRRSFDATTAFSVAPLRAATLAGLALGALALLAVPVALLFWILGGFGTTELIIALLLLVAGALLLTLVIVGEYVGRIYEEVKRRPLYVVRDWRNLPAAQAAQAPQREPASTL